MNSWGSAASAIYYVNYEYLKGGLGPYNRLIRVLKNQVPEKFAERSAYRKGKDPAKVWGHVQDFGMRGAGRGQHTSYWNLEVRSSQSQFSIVCNLIDYWNDFNNVQN